MSKTCQANDWIEEFRGLSYVWLAVRSCFTQRCMPPAIASSSHYRKCNISINVSYGLKMQKLTLLQLTGWSPGWLQPPNSWIAVYDSIQRTNKCATFLLGSNILTNAAHRDRPRVQFEENKKNIVLKLLSLNMHTTFLFPFWFPRFICPRRSIFTWLI